MGELDRLAVFGGRPAFDEPRHVGAPNVLGRDRLLARISDLLDRRWLTNRGPLLQEFEVQLADRIGVDHVVATCNGTVALEIASRAMGMSGEVIVPAWTFVATAHALRWQEIRPLFADVDPRSHTISPASVESMITPRTTGIVGVHVWGRACDVDALEAIAAEHDLRLMFDAAHAFGCGYPGGEMIGTRGDAEIFSFHATKFLNTFEGGAIATNDADLAERCRLMTNFGFTGEDSVQHLGINGKMSEVSAAMGLTQLESMDEVVAHNRVNHATYSHELADVPGIRILDFPADTPHNHQYVVVEVDEHRAGINRDDLTEAIRAEGVLARRYFHPAVHRMEPYVSEQPHAGLLLPETERLSSAVMTLPTGTAMAATDVLRVCEVMRTLVTHGPTITSRLSERHTASA